MKLQQLLTEIFKNGPIVSQYGEDYNLSGDQLELRKDLLMACDEFKELKSLSFTRMPIYEDNGVNKIVKTTKLYKNTVFKGNFTMYSIYLTPEMYSITNLYNNPPKKDIFLTPTMYNPNTFTPLRYIVIPFSPEVTQDVTIPNMEDLETELKQKIHTKLDMLFENPNDFKLKGERQIIIRGVIDLVDYDNSNIVETITV